MCAVRGAAYGLWLSLPNHRPQRLTIGPHCPILVGLGPVCVCVCGPCVGRARWKVGVGPEVPSTLHFQTPPCRGMQA